MKMTERLFGCYVAAVGYDIYLFSRDAWMAALSIASSSCS